MGLRVISGNLKGRKLYTLPGKDIRPTSDRLRESIFNILSSRVSDAVFLDLFAGTGALGIEALSRGARFGVFIDKYNHAFDVIKKNIRLCSLDTKSKIIKWDIGKNLNCLIPVQHMFDMVFMDPPYHQNMVDKALNHLLQSQKLMNNACVIIEHSPLESILVNVSGLKAVDQRKYGKSVVSFLQHTF